MASSAAAATKPTTFISLLFFFFFFFIFFSIFSVTVSASSSSSSTNVKSTPSNPTSSDPIPTPTPWPHQFHSILVMNYSGSLSIIDLWYDWPKGRNFNIIQNQLGELLYDLEWNNGTSFFYTLDSNKKCRSAQLEVGILRPNWLDGANYLGQKYVDGFLCNVWEKVDFIWYYEDVVTKRPVHWVFYTGRNAHVMTFEVGAVLEDEKWQAPVYCFDKKKSINGEENTLKSAVDGGGGDILRKTTSTMVEAVDGDILRMTISMVEGFLRYQ